MNDIFLDPEIFDIAISGGDLVIGNPTVQNQQFLLLARKGEIRKAPRVGVGIENFLNDDKGGNLATIIKNEFERDGMKVDNLTISEDSNIKIEATYE